VSERVAVAAVDFGATSARVCRVELSSSGPPQLDVVHRYAHAPVRDDGDRGGRGTLRWDWARLVSEMERGLEAARQRGPIASIGVDTWGVDYGLLDRHGALVEPPISYRDERTAGYRTVVERIGEQRLYELAGLQLMGFNTIFQLAVHDRSRLGRAAHVVMLPELLVHHLTGEIVAEPTSAGTTGLLDVATCAWSDELCDAIGMPVAKLAGLLPAGTPVGTWQGTPVHLVGGHDTASAVVAGASSDPRTAFVSAGTWLLVGREQAGPDTSSAARQSNLSNERGALGGIRLLRNVAGWWLLEECRRRWGRVDVEALLAEAATVDEAEVGSTFDATDERFVAPADMEAEIRAAAGLDPSAPRALVARTIVESMAETTTAVVERLGRAVARPGGASQPAITGVRVFGGGSRSSLFLGALARRSGLDVSVGPVEATALGNALVQGISLGLFGSVAEARVVAGHDGELEDLRR
jgi:rhamnulokinase